MPVTGPMGNIKLNSLIFRYDLKLDQEAIAPLDSERFSEFCGEFLAFRCVSGIIEHENKNFLLLFYKSSMRFLVLRVASKSFDPQQLWLSQLCL